MLISSKLLKEARVGLELTKWEAAGYLNMSAARYAKLEAGAIFVGRGTAYRICDLFGLDREDAITRIDVPEAGGAPEKKEDETDGERKHRKG